MAGQATPLFSTPQQIARKRRWLTLAALTVIASTLGWLFYSWRGTQPEETWQPIFCAEGRFSFAMPGSPVHTVQTFPGGLGAVHQYTLELAGGQRGFSFVYAELPGELREVPLSRRFEGARAGLLQEMPGCSIVTDNELTQVPHPAREFVLVGTGKGIMVSQVHVIGDAVVTLTVAGSGFRRDSAEVGRFLNSFQINTASPTPAQP